jgi:hypothetical protein
MLKYSSSSQKERFSFFSYYFVSKYGYIPSADSHILKPNDQISVFVEYACPRNLSGDIYVTVPTQFFASTADSKLADTPKSPIFTYPSLFTSRLDGLMSL